MSVFAIRHGETESSLHGRYTGTTDIPLTDNGRRLAELFRPLLSGRAFALVLVSPLQRARETCELAGVAAGASIAGSRRVELREVPGADAPANPRRGAGLAVEDPDGTLRKCIFSVPPMIPARVSFRVDHRAGLVSVLLTVVDRLERVTLEFPSAAIDEPALEDLVRPILGRDSAFLGRAPLAGLHGRASA